jgi:hypothetical protein
MRCSAFASTLSRMASINRRPCSVGLAWLCRPMLLPITEATALQTLSHQWYGGRPVSKHILQPFEGPPLFYLLTFERFIN